MVIPDWLLASIIQTVYQVVSTIPMNQNELKNALSKLPLGDVKYFDSVGSTNNEALAWATNDAKDLSLVIADEQTAGRGRLDRKWFTPKGTALAFSLILRPTAEEKPYLTRMVGLAALAVVDSLQTRGLVAQIKWPNDVLLNGRKVAGILVKSVWSGEEVDCLVIGIGVNILKGAVPSAELLQFPATSLEESLGPEVEREEILHDILAGIIALDLISAPIHLSPHGKKYLRFAANRSKWRRQRQFDYRQIAWARSRMGV